MADVCVVGAGVAGALAAWYLAEAGHDVVMLDTGPRFTYPDMERYARLQRGGDPWPWYREERDHYEDNARPSLGLNRNRIKAVGGTTLHWNGNAQRLQPGDFRMQSAHGVAVDWPLDYEEIEPWYMEAERQLGVSGGDAPGHPPRSGPFPLPAFDISYAEREFIVPAFEALGLPIGANTVAINSRPHDGRPPCAVFSTCIPMCPIGARYSALHHVDRAETTGRLEVRPEAHVRRLVTDGRRRVARVRYVDRNGLDREQSARCFVLAGGGVEIPRLLLLSASTDYPDGLANSSGMVGRNYMSHPRIIVKGRLPEKLGPHRNGYHTTNCWALYQHELLPDTGNIMLSPDPNAGEHPSEIASKSKLWGVDLLSHVREQHGQHLDIHVKGDMLPLPENRVRLSRRAQDNFGDPIPVVDMRFSDFDRRALDMGAGVAHRIFEQLRARDVHQSDYGCIQNHLMGATRMGHDAAASVCDRWGRCHDLDNLYIAGSSLFPTAGCSSPTLTIAALSLRTADYLHRQVL